ncbi:MAG TPA: glucose-6-phosphate isomerase, partial [Nevskia sp.]|nr:glucose-6-phosphate isomerase [Nevskia sp.]
NRAEVEKFGIDPANMFEFWDWVGGRYSLWSAVGLSIVVALGPARFRELLAGAHAMDEHFRSVPFSANLPVLLGLLAVWNNNFLGAASQVVAPYAQDLEFFVPWLQQLEMESNGKSVDRQGAAVDYPTTPALWGDVGTNSQHAFFQMLHQGSGIHAVDFILPLRAAHSLDEQQRMLIANCLAQSAALMLGKPAATVREELQARGLQGEALEHAIPPRVFGGNRPSNTLLLPQLDARHLGALLALYEQRTFVMSVLWNINAFDQWGVELGKQLAQSVLKAMEQDTITGLDASTAALLARTRN